MIRCTFFLTSICIDFNHEIVLVLGCVKFFISFLRSSICLYLLFIITFTFHSLLLRLPSVFTSNTRSLVTHAFPFHVLFLYLTPPRISLTSLLPFFRLLYFLLLPFALGVAHGEEEQPALFCSSGLSSLCRTQMVIMELHIN